MRMQTLGADGKSLGIVLPDPKNYPFTEKTQKDNVNRLCTSLMAYRQVIEIKRDGSQRVYFTKGRGHEDDTVDMLTMACSVLPQMGKTPFKPNVSGFVRGMYGV